MNLTDFFESVLGAQLRNVRWSWGAVNPNTGDVFFRVWKDQIRTIDGQPHVDVFTHGPRADRPGAKERARHLDRVRAGFRLFGVVCEAVDPQAVPRSIARFDDQELLVLGDLVEEDGRVWARIVDAVAVDNLPESPAPREEPDVLEALSVPDATERDALRTARIGQRAFRAAVLARWNGRCAVTGCGARAAIRASHIKPWKVASDAERLDAANGLPLAAHVDALFDIGLITFDEKGQLVQSKNLADEDAAALFGDARMKLRSEPSPETKAYLAWHRDHVFQH